jgi:hypothetical protein
MHLSIFFAAKKKELTQKKAPDFSEGLVITSTGKTPF